MAIANSRVHRKRLHEAVVWWKASRRFLGVDGLNQSVVKHIPRKGSLAADANRKMSARRLGTKIVAVPLVMQELSSFTLGATQSRLSLAYVSLLNWN